MHESTRADMQNTHSGTVHSRGCVRRSVRSGGVHVHARDRASADSGPWRYQTEEGQTEGRHTAPASGEETSAVFQVSIPARGAEANENAAAAAGTGPDRYKEQYLRRSQGGVSSSPLRWARQDHRGCQPAWGSARQFLLPAWDQGHRLRPR